MKLLRFLMIWMVVVGMAASAAAGDLTAGIARAVEQQEPATKSSSTSQPPMSKACLWSGASLFAGGMAAALNGFLNNRNGEFPEFGEADSTNVAVGAAGLAAAVGGGMLLLLGKKRVSRVSSIHVGPGRLSAAAKFVW